MRAKRRMFLALLAASTALGGLTGPAPAKPAHAKPAPPPGGANQVEGRAGKVGDLLFDGHWRFLVRDVQTLPTYTLKVPSSGGDQDYAKYHDAAEYDNATHIFTPKDGFTLVAVECRASNGQHAVHQLDFYEDPKTAITDDQSDSFPPIAYDMLSKGPWTTKEMLPGSGETLTILFAVPTGTKTQSLVVSLKNWYTEHTGRLLRVALTP